VNRDHPVTLRRVIATWWPLAGSWALMGLELPAITAVLARLAHPETSLAAYGGIVFPLAILVEAPIIMLLAASTALSADLPSYLRLRRFMVGAAAVLSLLHVAVAFTPLYDLVVGGLIDAPPEIHEPGRLGLMIMTPWTGSIALRRFQQGVLIRFGRSGVVGVGTLVRLFTLLAVLAIGVALVGDRWPGIAVGTLAASAAVMAEAFFVNRRVQPILAGPLREAHADGEPLSWGGLTRFYVPLALTPMLGLLAQPIGSATMSRLPDPVASLAVWPTVSTITFLLRSIGIAFNEVVVALLGRPGALPALRRFAFGLAAGVTVAILLVAGTPLSILWFEGLFSLRPELVDLGRSAIWIPLLAPAAGVFQSYYQGMLVHSRKTRAVTESVVAHLVVLLAVQGIGVVVGRFPGIHVVLAGILAGLATQVLWLRWRSTPVRSSLRASLDLGGDARRGAGTPTSGAASDG